jgi:hypothetical protein
LRGKTIVRSVKSYLFTKGEKGRRKRKEKKGGRSKREERGEETPVTVVARERSGFESPQL